MEVVGSIPTTHGAEEAQFERVLDILRSAEELFGSWSYLIFNHGFSHERGEVMERDQDWNGEIDILLISPNKIVIYELKGFTATVVQGSTDSNPWRIKRLASGIEETVGSYFIQASKQRAFVVQDFFRRFDRRHPEYAHNHWIVDSRLVFRTGSDLSGFAYSVPRTESPETLQTDILPLVANDDDRLFVADAFSGEEYGTGKLGRIGMTEAEEQRLRTIYKKNGITPRTARWFGVITEDQIPSDLPDTGSDRFLLDQKAASGIIDDLLAEAWTYGQA